MSAKTKISPPSAKDQPHYAGHRERLRTRFLKSGGADLADYELLELLLCTAMPRRDVKPIAKALIKHFGSFAAVLSAKADDLQAVNGVGEVAAVTLMTVRQASERMLKDDITDKPVLSNWQSLMDYCRVSMAHKRTEQVRVLYLNRKNMLIADELQQEGTVDHTPVYPREVIKRALELTASALILVHNHPSGDPTPSQADIDMTREIKIAGEKLGIQMHDHVIISKNGNSSFKTMGIL